MSLDWSLLKKLREHFLSDGPGLCQDYWENAQQLEQYDRTFAERIGWKWDAVLRELKELGWAPGAEKPALLDWGCGTGIAARRFLGEFPSAHYSEVHYWDRSRLARAFAHEKLKSLVGDVPLSEGVKRKDPSHPYVLLISHVLGELGEKLGEELLALVSQAQTVIWVEPGTPELSRRLIELRENLRGIFHCWAPCPHQERCGLLTLENARHWCHHFAEPPPEVFQSAEWAKFSRELSIDLRSLPVSYLVLDRRPAPARPARLIGRPRVYKGYALALRCDSSEVREVKVENRKSFKKNHFRIDL